ncbi:hypothetical protein MSL71_9470 [Desulfoluna butyratoxydans]|uniref:Uncharacterized protein n=1 Tax=Desulfoluna butyratoxydans TaxID=231438 RepID=A0A4U8YJS2_9BACT|nr:hypothetical protein MSL71_9470 [Desulfoluna butyratoxydans]
MTMPCDKRNSDRIAIPDLHVHPHIKIITGEARQRM